MLRALLVPTTGLCKDVLEIEFKRAFEENPLALLTVVEAGLLFDFLGKIHHHSTYFCDPYFWQFFICLSLSLKFSQSNRGVFVFPVVPQNRLHRLFHLQSPHKQHGLNKPIAWFLLRAREVL